MAEIPDIVIWAIVFAVIIQGFSMALLVYLMYQRRKDEKKATPLPETPPEEESEERP
ncbi:MAG: hypothetical protein V3U51_07385 [Thermoplasmata archaeon]